jgi:hypothetical protein
MTENDVMRERLQKIAELAGRRIRIDSSENELHRLRDDICRYIGILEGAADMLEEDVPEEVAVIPSSPQDIHRSIAGELREILDGTFWSE